MTDPLGYTDFLYFYQNPSITPGTDSACIVPTGLSSNDNTYLSWRNTYHWDKHAFALGSDHEQQPGHRLGGFHQGDYIHPLVP